MALRSVSAQQAAMLMYQRGVTYLDVRTVEEWREGHPAGARHVPWQTRGPSGLVVNPNFAQDVAKVVPGRTRIVVGCKKGTRSLAAAKVLEAEGMTKVVVARGGFDGVRDPFGEIEEPGWVDMGLPVERGD